jgi:hypothetical protein
LGGAGVRLAVAAVFALIVIAAVAVPVSNLGSSIQIPTIATPVVPTTNAPSQHTIQTHHTQAASYLTAFGLRAGLAHIGRVAPGARLSLVRVAGDSLIATARLPNGRIKQIVFEPTGTFVTGEPDPGERFLPMAQIRPSAVVRIVAALRTKFHVPAGRIDYIVLSSPTGAATQWIAFLKAPGHPGFSATLSGTRLSRLPG